MHRVHYTTKQYREEYLKSPEWKEKSRATLDRDPICRICDTDPSVDAHHVTYERIHHELDTDLIGVCRSCHNVIHRHKELSEITDIDNLRSTFRKIKEGKILDSKTYFRILDLGVHAESVICRKLKLSPRELKSLVGKNVGFFNFMELEALLLKREKSVGVLKKRTAFIDKKRHKLSVAGVKCSPREILEIRSLIDSLIRKNLQNKEFEAMSSSEKTDWLGRIVAEVYFSGDIRDAPNENAVLLLAGEH